MRSRSLKRVWRRKERIAQANTSAPAQERGTVLLMVIGVLALLAIIAVVYASLGQSDRRTSTALVRSVQIDDVSGQISNYIAGIIGQDVTQEISEVYQGQSANGPKRFYHASWSIPGIAYDDTVKSNPANNQARYKPVGGGYQPWLAPSEPTFIRFNGTDPWTDNEQQFLDFKDWLTISNIVPNGQFINLANLRDNFYAEPGTGTDANGRPRLSRGLTLYGPNGLPFRSGFVQMVDGRTADVNIPWHWTAMQRHAARPIANFQSSRSIPGPSQDEYYPNQWADADGDGIGDSRWFELSDLAGVNDQWSRPGISQQDRARYFVAARIVDLNGMININTATDLRNDQNNNAPGPLVQNAGDPTVLATHPFGITPADTDLLRLLTLEDAYQRYDAGYDALQQGGGVNSPANYTQYVNTGANPVAYDVGRSAYAALQWSIATDRRPDIVSPRPNGQVPSYDPVIAAAMSIHHETTYLERLEIFGAAQADAGQVGYSDQGYITYQNQTVGAVRTKLPFGMNELLELHTFFGVNDPRERSRLEAVLDGRRNTGPNARPSFGPLRSSRGLDLERERRGDTAADGQQDDDSLAQQHLDIRHNLTTITDVRPLTSLGYKYGYKADELSDTEVRIDLTPYLHPRRPITADGMMELFNHALDALMPYRNGPNSTRHPFNVTQAANRALQYGGSGEFAMRSLAHWMANIIDSTDDDNSTDANVRGPTCISLRSVVERDVTAHPGFPWPEISIRHDSQHLELPRLSDRFSQSPRVNIYGIEAQPFLVEAASYVFFIDMSRSRGPAGIPLLPGQDLPDEEFPNPPIDPPPPVTIDTTVSYNNADFLGEIIGFQVTNPFERELYVTRAGGAGPEFLYYVEYAKRFFPLARMDENNADQFVNEDVVLNPGETRVFYATSPRREFNLEERFKVINGATWSPNAIPANFVQQWVDHQFKRSSEPATEREPVHTTMFDPTTFTAIAPGDSSGAGDPERGLMDLHGDDAGATAADRRVVNLWRILRTDSNALNPDPIGQPNVTTNDLLADRLHDPAPDTNAATLFQRAEVGNHEVDGSHAGPDNVGPSGGLDPLDNTGLTVTLWGAVRRPTNPVDDASLDRVQKGAMPPWCIEARLDQDYSWTAPPNPNPGDLAGTPNDPNIPSNGRRSLNLPEDGPPGIGNIRDYGPRDQTLYRTAAEMVADQAQGSGGTRINHEIRNKAEDKEGNRIPPSQSKTVANVFRTFNEQAIRISLGGKDIHGNNWNAGLYRRVGDILLPLAIGPFYDPMIAAHPENPDDTRRMALSEALALAMDYYSPPAPTGNNRAPYFRAGHSDPTTPNTPANPTRPKLDAGHFVIDDFSPFNDANNNGTFDPSLTNKNEAPLGLGIPLALNLLDKFRLDSISGKTRGDISRVNVNTASLTALSVLPMLAPDMLSPWVTKDFPFGAPDPEREAFYDPSAQTQDRAAAIIAYRDKIEMRTRPLYDVANGPAQRSPNATMEVGFRDTTPALITPWTFDGRRVRTQIPFLREDRGIRSVGELLAINLRTLPATVSTPAQITQYQSNGMDWLGRDVRSFKGQRGIEPVNVVVPGPAGPGTYVEGHDAVVDDYGEKLAIANAALNSVTTRSDAFCVWFVVHGYLPSDVNDLGANDPLIPSISRRYMMIVDRSNVIKKGDKPRILMFREVPL